MITGGMILICIGLQNKYSAETTPSLYRFYFKPIWPGCRSLWMKVWALSTVEKYLAIVIILSLIVGGFIVLLFPMFGADVYIYHLPIAETIFNTGYLPTSTSPSRMEGENAYPPLVFLYYGTNWLVYGAAEHVIPKMTSFLFGILLLGAVYTIVRQILDSTRIAGLIAVLLTLEMQSFRVELLHENIDFPFSFYCIGSFYFVLRGFRRHNIRELILGSIFLALACWSKYHGIVFAGIFSVLIFGFSVYRRYINTAFALDLFLPSRIIKLFWLPCILLFAPLLIRNLVRWGNPVYPAFQQIIGGYLIDEWSLTWISSTYLPDGLFYNFQDTGIRLLVMAFLPFFVMSAYDAFRDRNCVIIFAFLLCVGFILCGSAIMPLKGNGDTTRYLFAGLLIGTALSGKSLFDLFVDDHKRGNGVAIFMCGWWIMIFFVRDLEWPDWNYFAEPSKSLVHTMNRMFLSATDKLVFITPLVLSGLFLGDGILAKCRPKFYSRLKTIGATSIISLVIWSSLQTEYKRLIHVYKNSSIWINAPYNPTQKQWQWMADHLPEDAVTITFDERIYNIPGRVFPADTPLLKKFYQTDDLESAVLELKKHGITHIYIGCVTEGFHPLYHLSVVFQNLDDSRYFKQVYYDDQGTGVYPVTSFPVINQEGFEASGYQLLPRQIAIYEIQTGTAEIK